VGKAVLLGCGSTGVNVLGSVSTPASDNTSGCMEGSTPASFSMSMATSRSACGVRPSGLSFGTASGVVSCLGLVKLL